MALTVASSSSGVPSPYAADQALADSQSSSSSGSVNSCEEEAQALNLPKVLIQSNVSLRKTAVTNAGYPDVTLKSKNLPAHFSFHIFIASMSNVSEINSALKKRALILQPISAFNPDCSSIETAKSAIRRLVIWIYDHRNGDRFILHDNLINRIEQVASVIVADLDVDQEVKENPGRVFRLIESSKVKKSFLCYSSELNDRYIKFVDKDAYNSSDIFECASKRFAQKVKEIVSDIVTNISLVSNSAIEQQKAFEESRRRQEAEDAARALAVGSLVSAQMQSHATGHYVAPAITLPAARQAANATYGVKADSPNACSVQ